MKYITPKGCRTGSLFIAQSSTLNLTSSQFGASPSRSAKTIRTGYSLQQTGHFINT
jgi:hypothetical protein